MTNVAPRFVPALAVTTARTLLHLPYFTDARFHAYRLDIHHLPWQLQPAEADIKLNTMTTAAGITLPSMAPLLHFATRQDMVAWAPESIDSRGRTERPASAS